MGISKNYVNLIENGKKTPGDRLLSDICREFNINEEWLRYGIGPMKKPVEDEIAECVENLLSTDEPFYDLIKGIMKTYQKLDDKSQKAVTEFSESLLKEFKREN